MSALRRWMPTGHRAPRDKSHYNVEHLRARSEVRGIEHFGILRLDLAAGGYAWRFLATGAAAEIDSGQAACREADARH